MMKLDIEVFCPRSILVDRIVVLEYMAMYSGLHCRYQINSLLHFLQKHHHWDHISEGITQTIVHFLLMMEPPPFVIEMYIVTRGNQHNWLCNRVVTLPYHNQSQYPCLVVGSNCHRSLHPQKIPPNSCPSSVACLFLCLGFPKDIYLTIAHQSGTLMTSARSVPARCLFIQLPNQQARIEQSCRRALNPNVMSGF